MNMNIQELDIKQKEVMGSGLEHQIFQSKTNPNLIYKVGHKDVVEEWFEVFKSNPEIFPKVFRAGKMKDTDYYYVELEKLDTKSFEKDWDDVFEKSLVKVGSLMFNYESSFTDFYMDKGSDSEIFKEIAKELYSYNKDDYNFFIKLLTVIKETEKTILKVLGKETIVDAHKYNFGYGKDKKIKCLDL